MITNKEIQETKWPFVKRLLEPIQSMKTKHKIFLIIYCFLFIGTAMIVRPVPIVEEDKCKIFEGTVVEIFEGAEYDIVFTFKEETTHFYINRGLERGLNLNTLRNDLVNNKITVKYPRYWTPLDPSNSTRHLSKLEFDGITIFSELDH